MNGRVGQTYNISEYLKQDWVENYQKHDHLDLELYTSNSITLK